MEPSCICRTRLYVLLGSIFPLSNVFCIVPRNMSGVSYFVDMFLGFNIPPKSTADSKTLMQMLW